MYVVQFKLRKITAKDKLKCWVSGPVIILIKKIQIYYQLYKRNMINMQCKLI